MSQRNDMVLTGRMERFGDGSFSE